MELDRLPAEIQFALAGAGFRARRRLALPFLTVDPGGFPRAALLTLGEVRAQSRTLLAVAVRAGSHTAANLIRRKTAMLFYLARNKAVWVQGKAGRGRVSLFDADRQIFPLAVVRVKVDRPLPEEGAVALAGGPTLSTGSADRLYSEELFEDLGRRGIGRSIALRFAEEGARLALAARTENELLQTATMVEQSGARAVAIPTDIRERAAVDACVARAEAELGPIDVLVNNAGVFLWRPFLELSSEEWDLVLSTNLTGAANFCRAVLPGMIGRRRGRIVNVSSIHGVRGEANLAAHSAAKFGLIGLTQSLAREYRSFNIAVNAVCPGTVENRQDETGEPSRAEPLAEKLWPRDVARTVLFLASDDAAAITGAALEVLGGTHLTIQP